MYYNFSALVEATGIELFSHGLPEFVVQHALLNQPLSSHLSKAALDERDELTWNSFSFHLNPA